MPGKQSDTNRNHETTTDSQLQTPPPPPQIKKTKPKKSKAKSTPGIKATDDDQRGMNVKLTAQCVITSLTYSKFKLHRPNERLTIGDAGSKGDNEQQRTLSTERGGQNDGRRKMERGRDRVLSNNRSEQSRRTPLIASSGEVVAMAGKSRGSEGRKKPKKITKTKKQASKGLKHKDEMAG